MRLRRVLAFPGQDSSRDRQMGRSSGFRIDLPATPSRGTADARLAKRIAEFGKWAAVVSCSLRPRLQRRDRNGFAPFSLFSGRITHPAGTHVTNDPTADSRGVNPPSPSLHECRGFLRPAPVTPGVHRAIAFRIMSEVTLSRLGRVPAGRAFDAQLRGAGSIGTWRNVISLSRRNEKVRRRFRSCGACRR